MATKSSGKSKSYYQAKAKSMGLLDSSGGVTSKGSTILKKIGGTPTPEKEKVTPATTPTVKTMSDQQKSQLTSLYNKAVQSGTGSDFLKKRGADLSKAGYGDVQQTLGVSKDTTVPKATPPVVVAPVETPTPSLKTDTSKMKIVGDNVYDDKGTLLGSKDIVLGTQNPVEAQVQTATEMQKPTEKSVTVDLGTMDKFGAAATEIQGLDATFLDRRNEKIIAGLGESAKDVNAVKSYLESQPGFKEASIEEQQNTIKNIVQQAVAKKEVGESELPAVNDMMAMAEEWNKRDLEENEKYKQELINGVINPMREYNAEIADNLDAVVGERFKALNSNFQAINNSILQLQNTANDLFDVNKMIARQNQAKQLADTGILTGEQAAQAAQYSLQDYTMNVELKRAEIAQQMQEQITTALKEKSSMEDQILQQKGINETVKQGMMQNLNTMYENVITKANTNLMNANNKMDELVANAQNTNIQVDMMSKGPLIQEKANQELVGQKLQQANVNPAYRYQYVIDTITNIAPSLVGRATALMRTYQKNGTFMQQDAQAFISELMSKMQSSGTTTANSTISSSTPSGTSNPNDYNSITYNSDTSRVPIIEKATPAEAQSLYSSSQFASMPVYSQGVLKRKLGIA